MEIIGMGSTITTAKAQNQGAPLLQPTFRSHKHAKQRQRETILTA